MQPNDFPLTRIVLIQVRDSLAKMQGLTSTLQLHFERKEKVTLFVEDQKTYDYVDNLLWKFPPESFLPHGGESDWIAITTSKKLVNGASIAFNLCTTPLLLKDPIRIIYEFEDLSHPLKAKLFSLRFDAYKEAQYLIESRNVSPYQ